MLFSDTGPFRIQCLKNCCVEGTIHSVLFMFFLPVKYRPLVFPLHPVGCCFLYAVRAVGVEDGGPVHECWALYAGMCGLRSPLVLPFRWRRKRGGGGTVVYDCHIKNLTFNGELQTALYGFLVELTVFTSKHREELGKL